VDLPQIAASISALDAETAPTAACFPRDGFPHGRAVVLPSAFNPPTVAHLRLLELARNVTCADSAVALLTTRNVAKGVFGADLPDRIAMLLAIQDTEPELSVVAANVARIADQARALRSALPGVDFDFVVGYDTLVRLFEPRFYSDMRSELAAFFADHQVIAANRASADVGIVRAFLEEPHVAPFANRITVLALDEYSASLSSTGAREEVATGIDSSALPAPVLAYIRERGLYGA
jgi:nicotinic acid mononucleotide adenylyltransferase